MAQIDAPDGINVRFWLGPDNFRIADDAGPKSKRGKIEAVENKSVSRGSSKSCAFSHFQGPACVDAPAVYSSRYVDLSARAPAPRTGE